MTIYDDVWCVWFWMSCRARVTLTSSPRSWLPCGASRRCRRRPWCHGQGVSMDYVSIYMSCILCSIKLNKNINRQICTNCGYQCKCNNWFEDSFIIRMYIKHNIEVSSKHRVHWGIVWLVWLKWRFCKILKANAFSPLALPGLSGLGGASTGRWKSN